MAMLLGQDQRTADVFSLTPMQLIKLRSVPSLQALDRCPGCTKAMTVLQSQRQRSRCDWYVLRGEDATTLILATLVELAVQGDQGQDPRSVIPDLMKREIAGLARGTTSRILAGLRSRDILEEDDLGMRIVNLEPFRKRGLLGGTRLTGSVHRTRPGSTRLPAGMDSVRSATRSLAQPPQTWASS